jgi:hypothetical protein
MSASKQLQTSSVDGLPYIAEAHILNQVGVQVASLVDLLQQRIHHEIEIGVLEATLLALGQRRPNSQCDHDIVGVLLGAAVVLAELRRL